MKKIDFSAYKKINNKHQVVWPWWEWEDINETTTIEITLYNSILWNMKNSDFWLAETANTHWHRLAHLSTVWSTVGTPDFRIMNLNNTTTVCVEGNR